MELWNSFYLYCYPFSIGGLMSTPKKHWCVLKDDTMMWFRGKQVTRMISFVFLLKKCPFTVQILGTLWHWEKVERPNFPLCSFWYFQHLCIVFGFWIYFSCSDDNIVHIYFTESLEEWLANEERRRPRNSFTVIIIIMFFFVLWSWIIWFDFDFFKSYWVLFKKQNMCI